MRTYRKQENPEKTPEDIHLVYEDTSYETGMSYYSLSTRTSYEDWKKIKDYFQFFTRNDEEDSMYNSMRGWLTPNYAKVEQILHVKPEWTIEAQRERAKKRKEEEDAKEKLWQDKMAKINSYFKGAEYPTPLEGEHMFVLEGERVENPRRPQDIYGTGEWYVIQPDWIWYVQNNGMDGDNWAYNNVRTGGAGAIGKRVPYNQELAELIRTLMEVKQ